MGFRRVVLSCVKPARFLTQFFSPDPSNTPAAGGTGAPTIEASLAPTLGLEPLQPGAYIDRSHPKRPRNWHET
jgi:hypothetical protein